MLIVCGSVPTLKPLYDEILGRKASRSFPPRISKYPKKGVYKSFPDGKTPSAKLGFIKQSSVGNSTLVASQTDQNPWPNNGTNEDVNSRDINVQQTYQVAIGNQSQSSYPLPKRFEYQDNAVTNSDIV